MTKTNHITLLSLVLLFGVTEVVRAQAQSSPKLHQATQEKNIQIPSKAGQEPPRMSVEQLRQELLRARPDKFGHKVTNATAVRARNRMVALLRQQQQAAAAERALILATRRDFSISKQAQGQLVQTRTKDRVSSQSATIKHTGTPIIPDAPGRSSAHPQYAQASPGLCAQPAIYTVNGSSQGVVFTPQTQYDLYTIKGCKFGEQQGEVHLYGHFKSTMIKMVVEFWSDSSIVAAVDPGVSGELDQDNVALVVKTTGAGQVQQGGFRFYAARETVLLSSLPADHTFLNHSFVSPWTTQYLSPVPDSQGWTAHVVRSGDFKDAQGADDSYSLRGLTAGFDGDSVQLAWGGMTQLQCAQKIGGQLVTHGSFNVYWDDQGGVLVEYPAQQCISEPFGNIALDSSNYWMAIWVTGPRGVEPQLLGRE